MDAEELSEIMLENFKLYIITVKDSFYVKSTGFHPLVNFQIMHCHHFGRVQINLS